MERKNLIKLATYLSLLGGIALITGIPQKDSAFGAMLVLGGTFCLGIVLGLMASKTKD